MKRVLSIVAIMVLSLCVAMAQSPKQEGAAYAKRIVDSAVKGNYEAISQECMNLYSYIMELEIEEHELFVEGFQLSALESCEENGLSEEQADSLITFLDDIMVSIVDYKVGDDTSVDADDEQSVEFEY